MDDITGLSEQFVKDCVNSGLTKEAAESLLKAEGTTFLAELMDTFWDAWDEDLKELIE